MASDYIKMDAAAVASHIDALVARFPELAEDEALRADMIEGETALDQVIARALDHMSEADMMVDAIGERCSQQQERQGRYKRRSDAMRGLIKDLMLTANLKSLALPEATVSIGAGRDSVVITDESSLPSQLGTTMWSPDKKAIAEQLKSGEVVPGAELKTGEPSLTVRKK